MPYLYGVLSVVMVSSILLVNYYTNRISIKDISTFSDDLFSRLDYNIIIIFTGLFIVSGSFLDTYIPHYIWNILYFDSVYSLVLLCVYITVSSQFIGNVPVVYMAKDQLLDMSDEGMQVLGWIVLSWVATVRLIVFIDAKYFFIDIQRSLAT